MNAEVKRFMSDLQEDEQMQKEFKAVEGDLDAVVAKANARGYKFNRSDIESKEGELSEDDLDQVAGGWNIGCDGNTVNPTIQC